MLNTNTKRQKKRILQTGKVHFDNSTGWSLLEIYVVSHATVKWYVNVDIFCILGNKKKLKNDACLSVVAEKGSSLNISE